MREITIAVMFALVPLVANAESVGEMRSACAAVSEATMVDGKAEVPSDFDSGKCWGAFAIIQELMGLSSSPDRFTPYFRVCVPKAVTRVQLIAVFVAYASKHPERWHDQFLWAALDPLREAFPCK